MVLADGCFDCLHVGHVRYLVSAAHLGPVAVRVAPDADIVAKGRRPFQTQTERGEMLLALRMVERVTYDATLAAAVRRLTPQYLVKGDDWQGRLPTDVVTACQETGTKILFTQTRERTSTERLRA